MAHSRKSWEALVEMPDVDIALLQEASRVPESLCHRVDIDARLWPEHHSASMGYPSVVARLSDRVKASFIRTREIGGPYSHDFYTSEWGTLGAAVVVPADGDESLIVVSMAAGGDNFTRESGSPGRREATGSVHRLISDLARLVGRRSRVIAAGDWSIFRGWSDHPTKIWKEREALHFQTAFDRMRALGFRHLMPEGRHGYRGGCGGSSRSASHPRRRGDNSITSSPLRTSPTESPPAPSTAPTTGAQATTAASRLTSPKFRRLAAPLSSAAAAAIAGIAGRHRLTRMIG